MEKQKDLEGSEAEADKDSDVIVVKEVVDIPDGEHKGHITNMIRETRKGFDYVDLYIDLADVKDVNNEAVSLKAGFPCNVSEKSSFGKLLKAVGMEFKPHDELSLSHIKKVLIGKNLSFTTYKEGDFSNIINKTIKFE